MTIILAVLAAITLAGGAAAAESAPPDCEVPERLLAAENDLQRVSAAINDHHRLDISVVGSRSSALSGPDGARFAYPAQLEQALRSSGCRAPKSRSPRTFRWSRRPRIWRPPCQKS